MCYPKKRLYSPCESWGPGIRGCPLTHHIRAPMAWLLSLSAERSILRLSVQAVRAGKNSSPCAFLKVFLIDLFSHWKSVRCYSLINCVVCLCVYRECNLCNVFMVVLRLKVNYCVFHSVGFSLLLSVLEASRCLPLPGCLVVPTTGKRKELIDPRRRFSCKLSSKWAITQ